MGCHETIPAPLTFIFELVFTYAASVFDSGFYFNPTLLSLSMALGAGFFEETIFRDVTIPLAMRYLKSKNRMYIIVGITALIFGILHIGSIFQGANPTMAVIQGISTIFGGFLYAAVYLRSGSILVPIFALYLIRPAMRDKIQTLWNEKWGIE